MRDLGWREISDDELVLRDRREDVEPYKGWVFTDYSQGLEMVYVELSKSLFYRRDVGMGIVPNFDVTFFCPKTRDGATLGLPDINKKVLNPNELEELLKSSLRGFGLFDGCPDFRSAYQQVMEQFVGESSEK